jgi:hypothetical protein
LAELVATMMGMRQRYLAIRRTGSRLLVMTMIAQAAMSRAACTAERHTASSVGIGLGVKRDTWLKNTRLSMPTCVVTPPAEHRHRPPHPALEAQQPGNANKISAVFRTEYIWLCLAQNTPGFVLHRIYLGLSCTEYIWVCLAQNTPGFVLHRIHLGLSRTEYTWVCLAQNTSGLVLHRIHLGLSCTEYIWVCLAQNISGFVLHRIYLRLSCTVCQPRLAEHVFPCPAPISTH